MIPACFHEFIPNCLKQHSLCAIFCGVFVAFVSVFIGLMMSMFSHVHSCSRKLSVVTAIVIFDKGCLCDCQLLWLSSELINTVSKTVFALYVAVAVIVVDKRCFIVSCVDD